jgi:hypothetical protein
MSTEQPFAWFVVPQWFWQGGISDINNWAINSLPPGTYDARTNALQTLQKLALLQYPEGQR